MSGLVGYGSSDEEDDELQPEKPAKMARLDDDAGLQATNDAMGAQTAIAPQNDVQEPSTAPYAPAEEPPAPSQPDEPPLGPAPGPAAPPPPAVAAEDETHPTVPSDPAPTDPDDPTNCSPTTSTSFGTLNVRPSAKPTVTSPGNLRCC
ncbi:hypothetical protein KC326_g9300 [Hortaea werneckii]|nr:hypothetical protein KC326_g9300 [Hortaea werneckii]